MRGRRPTQFRHLRAAYRSGLEATLAAALATAGVPVSFEQHRIPYTQPEKARNYTPDFVLPNGIVVETKGLFTAEDRAKMLWVQAQHPTLDIRMVFSNAKAKLRKGSPTTYAEWCDKNGIPWAHKVIPAEWLREVLRDGGRRQKAIARFLK
jgi:hypothetical protein